MPSQGRILKTNLKARHSAFQCRL